MHSSSFTHVGVGGGEREGGGGAEGAAPLRKGGERAQGYRFLGIADKQPHGLGGQGGPEGEGGGGR